MNKGINMSMNSIQFNCVQSSDSKETVEIAQPSITIMIIVRKQ